MHTRTKIEKMQSRIMMFGIIGNTLRMFAIVLVLVLAGMAAIHIEKYGLKHLLDLIWFGPLK